MSLLVFGSVRASPGVTTTALAVAGCLRRRLVVEADCDGAVLALRYGLSAEPGLTTLAAAEGHPDAGEVLAHAQALPGEVPVLVGPDSPDQAVALWRSAGDRLAGVFAALDRDVVVDAGRLSPTSPALSLLPAASAVLVVTRPRAEELVPVARRLPALRRLNPSVVPVLVGDRPYSATTVASEMGCEVAGVVADDPKAARALVEGGSPGALARSALARTAATLTEALVVAGERPGSTTGDSDATPVADEVEVSP